MELHGGDIYTARERLHTEEILDFSASINPFGVPESVQQAMIAAMPQLVHYPDPEQRQLREAIGVYHQILPEQIVCGNGGADVLFRLMRAVSPKRALLPVPTFSEYAKALQEVGCTVERWRMPYPFVITETLLTKLEQGRYDCLVLCHPNNPTGTLIAPALLQKILETAEKKGIFVLLDACFYEMTADALHCDAIIEQTRRYSNLFVLKSLTKRYAIPGLRLGYGVSSDTALVERVHCMGQPWPVNTLAAVAGCAALQDIVYQKQFFLFLQQERQFLAAGLQELGFVVWESQANYVFFRSPHFLDLDRQLQTDHILLRHCDSYDGLNGEYYRTAVRTHDENRQLLYCLKKVVMQRRNSGWQQNQSW